MRKLEDKVAIITGGSGAIGASTAKLFLEEGAKVVLVDINEEALKKTADDLKSDQVSYVAADVTKSADVQKYVEHTLKTFGQIDVFFNNAGVEGQVKPIQDYPEEAFDQLMAVNVKGVWLGLKYVMP